MVKDVCEDDERLARLDIWALAWRGNGSEEQSPLGRVVVLRSA